MAWIYSYIEFFWLLIKFLKFLILSGVYPVIVCSESVKTVKNKVYNINIEISTKKRDVVQNEGI